MMFVGLCVQLEFEKPKSHNVKPLRPKVKLSILFSFLKFHFQLLRKSLQKKKKEFIRSKLK